MRLPIVITLLLAVISSAVAQEDVMTLNSPELRTHERAPVRFGHELHTEYIGCNACHHDYDVYGVNINEEDGRRCEECHTQTAGENPIPLLRAFHLQCKGCHERLIGKGEASGPVMCGQCHIRGEK